MGMDTAQYTHFLGHIPVFKGLGEADLADLARLFKLQRVPDGTVLCNEGELGDAVFILSAGRVEVMKRTAQGDLQPLAELTAPTVVGEMALLDRGPRSATVRVKGGAEVYRIACADFDVLRGQFNRAAYKVIHNLALVLCERLRDTNEKIESFFADPERSLAEMKARQARLWEQRQARRGPGGAE